MRSRLPYFSLVFALMLLFGCTPTSPEAISIALQGENSGKEEVQTIPLDNCDGKADLTRTEKREQTVDSTISAEIAASLGASVEVISAEIRAAVGASQSIGNIKGTEITLTAPPNTHMVVDLVWAGTEQVGLIENLRGSDRPIAFRSFTPTDVRIRSQTDIGCPGSDTIRPIITTPADKVSSSTPSSQPESDSSSDDEASQSAYPTPKPPNSISRDEVLRLNFGEVPIEEVNRCLDQAHAGPRPFVSFTLSDIIPANALIASNFFAGGTIWSELPVVPICHNGSWGLFESTEPFQAPYDGAYWNITP